jgi:potassium-transporting ATPase KdpC subunit
MMRSVQKSLWLLAFAVVLVCGIYTGILWGIGQTFFPFQVNGSIVKGPDGNPVGSLLVAQPFTKDEYFQPRPSAASYDATASASSALAVSNYALRDRVARAIGPIAVYSDGPKKGQPVAPDVEAWFQADKFGGQSGIVAQWADAHNSLAQAWVTADPTHAAYIDAWAKEHPDVIAQFVKDNPDKPQPKASDLAVVFFEHFSKDHAGIFPSPVTHPGADGKDVTEIQPVKVGSDIQSIFFEMWREDHPDAPLQDVPGDYITTSGSGLDPDITLQNAAFRLDRVAGKWAQDLKRDPVQVRNEIEQMLQARTFSPGGGLFGEPVVNVLEMNLDLRKKYGPPTG